MLSVGVSVGVGVNSFQLPVSNLYPISPFPHFRISPFLLFPFTIELFFNSFRPILLPVTE